MVATFGKPVSGYARPLFGLALALLWVFAVGPFMDASAQTSMSKRNAMRANSPFHLASGPLTVLQANLVQCGLNNSGDVCTDVFNSPTGGGGYWPSGTTNQFIFNSGLQIAGIYGTGAPTSGVFARGDTVGAFFFDARGTQKHGTALTDIFNSLLPQDVANWPDAAIISDTSIYNAALVGSKAISDQDSYVEYWDGNPDRNSSRSHPMGIKVAQRSLSFNSPAGAENTIFFIYEFTNVTNDPVFQQLNEARFGQQLPDAGWAIDSIYAAFAMDPDVTTHAGNNFSTAILPLNMGIAYHAEFVTDDFNYGARADLYAPPFFQGPGFVGVKYLRSPVNPATGEEVGLTMFSNTTNGQPFPDPIGEKQLFRYLKGDVSAASGDVGSCTIANSVERRLCALVQQQADTRFFQAGGPFSLNAGQKGVIVVAYTHGAPVRVPGYVPGTEVRPGVPSVIPGVGTDSLRMVERIAGMLSIPASAVVRDDAGAAIGVDETELVAGRDFVRRSLIHNALIAQSIFDTKFLLPRPPEPPQFSLVPGDGQVTVVWAPSASDVNCVEGAAGSGGDPYFTIASDPESPQFNRNYRRCDVEGYKIYRSVGLTGNFDQIAQFHKVGSEWLDVTCELDPTFVPEEGLDCTPHAIPLTGEVIQYRPGGRVRDTGGNVQIISATPPAADTVVLSPDDEGIPFAFVDRGLRNGITYRYIVTAFDINSVFSGTTSLESARIPQFVTPRKDPNNFEYASFSSSVSTAAGTPLPTIAHPTINAATGIFSGPMPPTNGLDASFSPVVERLLPAFNLKASIDSIIPNTTSHPRGCPKGSSALGGCWRAFMTFDRDGVKTQSVSDGWTPHADFFGDPVHVTHPLGSAAVPPDPTAAAQFGLPASFPGFIANVVGTFPQSIIYSSSEGHFNRRAVAGLQIYPNFATGERFIPGGSRWFGGANETEPDPTRLIRVGTLPGVDTVWAPIHHTPQVPGAANANIFPGSVQMQCWSYWVPAISRAADIRFTWGAGGAVTVTDVSHGTPVIFKPTAQASFGFLNTDANGNGVIDWNDFNYLENVSPSLAAIDGGGAAGFCGHVDAPGTRVQLQATPVVNDVSTKGNCFRANGFCVNTDLAATGRGFGLYVNGERYIFQLTGGNLPGAGQTWTVRSYSGLVRCTTASVSLDPGGCTYWANFAPADIPEPRQPMVTGIQFNAVSTSATGPVGDIDMSTIHTVPDPYYVRSAFELGPSNKALRFVNVPAQAIIRIYSLNGTLVRVLEHNDLGGGAEASWDLRNRNNQFVASGVYFYVVEASNGEKFTGKFTVVQFAR